mmetsp:Transcript_6027/g.19479  ORF Transcript_6027/g.19479 Transcript_6027/m.19479 type:complete len:148 (-) Transcript_6027:397-840(-)
MRLRGMLCCLVGLFLVAPVCASDDDVAEMKRVLNITLQKLAELETWKAQHTFFDSGDTAWVMRSSSLIQMIALPGMALFYGGTAQASNVLSTVFQTFFICCLSSVLWFTVGYSLSFSRGSPVIGGADRFWLIGPVEKNNRISPITKK